MQIQNMAKMEEVSHFPVTLVFLAQVQQSAQDCRFRIQCRVCMWLFYYCDCALGCQHTFIGYDILYIIRHCMLHSITLLHSRSFVILASLHYFCGQLLALSWLRTCLHLYIIEELK